MKIEKIGIKKDVDQMGRICIPKEMRRLYNLDKEVEITATKEGILIKSFEYVLVKKSEIEKNK